MKYKCGFCGALKELQSPCPGKKCQKLQDEAKEAATEILGSSFFEDEEDSYKRSGFILGYYTAKKK